jgi:hypothetical protein
VINGVRILGLLFVDDLAVASFTIFTWSKCTVRYELNDRQETRRATFFLLFIKLDVDTVQCFGGILRLDAQLTLEMGFLKKLKFWRKKHNVSKKYRNINCKMGICYWLCGKLHVNTTQTKLFHFKVQLLNTSESSCKMTLQV